MKNPILYSFRRCPYAMRARMAIYLADIECELREVYLKNNTTRIKVMFESIIDDWKNNEKCLSITNKLPTRS